MVLSNVIPGIVFRHIQIHTLGGPHSELDAGGAGNVLLSPASCRRRFAGFVLAPPLPEIVIPDAPTKSALQGAAFMP